MSSFIIFLLFILPSGIVISMNITRTISQMMTLMNFMKTKATQSVIRFHAIQICKTQILCENVNSMCVPFVSVHKPHLSLQCLPDVFTPHFNIIVVRKGEILLLHSSTPSASLSRLRSAAAIPLPLYALNVSKSNRQVNKTMSSSTYALLVY